jgi:hypothetical protein
MRLPEPGYSQQDFKRGREIKRGTLTRDRRLLMSDETGTFVQLAGTALRPITQLQMNGAACRLTVGIRDEHKRFGMNSQRQRCRFAALPSNLEAATVR